MELMVAAALLALIFGAVFKAFMGGQKMAKMELENMVVNDDTHRLILRMLDEIRSSSVVDKDRPGFMPAGGGLTSYQLLDQRDSVNPNNPKNTLVLTQVRMDFSTNPISVLRRVATYTVEKDPSVKTASGAIMVSREVAEFDNSGALKSGPKKDPIIDNLDSFNFYRVSEFGAENVCFRVIMSRRDVDRPNSPTYTVKMVCSAKVRGSEPEGLKP
jgi:hypothetical protein